MSGRSLRFPRRTAFAVYSAGLAVALALAGPSGLFALTANVGNPWDVSGGSYYITAYPHCHGPGWTIPGRTGDGMTCVSGYPSPHPSEYQQSDMGNGAGGPSGDDVEFNATTTAFGMVVRGYVVAIGHPTGRSGQDVIHVRVEMINIYTGQVVDIGTVTYGHLYGAATTVSPTQYISVGTKIGVEDYAPTECAFPEHIHAQLIGVASEGWYGSAWWTMGVLGN